MRTKIETLIKPPLVRIYWGFFKLVRLQTGAYYYYYHLVTLLFSIALYLCYLLRKIVREIEPIDRSWYIWCKYVYPEPSLFYFWHPDCKSHYHKRTWFCFPVTLFPVPNTRGFWLGCILYGLSLRYFVHLLYEGNTRVN